MVWLLLIVAFISLPIPNLCIIWSLKSVQIFIVISLIIKRIYSFPYRLIVFIWWTCGSFELNSLFVKKKIEDDVIFSCFHWNFHFGVMKKCFHAWCRYVERTHLFASRSKRKINFVCISSENHLGNRFYHQISCYTISINPRQLNFKLKKKNTDSSGLLSFHIHCSGVIVNAQ